MRRATRALALAGTLAALVALSGCGVSPSGAGEGTSGGPTPLPSPTASVTPPAAAITRGAVTVSPAKTQFARGTAITVYINNGLSQSIFVADHQTACSLVTIELQSASGWRAMAPCRLMTPTRMVEVASGTTNTQQIVTSAAWPAGTYRARLAYALQAFRNPTTVYSGLFSVA